MKERPILFSTEMVRATLEDSKTQTRRTRGLNKINQHPDEWYYCGHYSRQPADSNFKIKPPYYLFGRNSSEFIPVKCPYGQIGDQLWVRETFHITNGAEIWENGTILYKADWGIHIGGVYVDLAKWKPSIFMPRHASRITLEITDIWVERVQDITWEDAVDEGISTVDLDIPPQCSTILFHDLWNSINEKRGYSWESNPYVWVIEFKRMSHDPKTTN
jgi:hypothetical protein